MCITACTEARLSAGGLRIDACRSVRLGGHQQKVSNWMLYLECLVPPLLTP